MGELAYRLGWRRRVVEDQLARAFPDRDEAWVRDTARACFRHVGREALTLPTLLRRGLPEVRRRLEVIDGVDEFDRAIKAGKGVVIVTGHFGNWELAGSTIAALGYTVDAVMQRLKNRYLNRLLEDTRRRLGMGLIDRVDAWDRLTGSLEAGRVVAFVADQDARRHGIFVPFMGRPASTHRAPALLALRAGVPFFVGGARRVGPGRYHGWVVPLEAGGNANVKERVYELTRQWVAELEARVRLSPEQYFWHHKRWKTAPPGN